MDTQTEHIMAEGEARIRLLAVLSQESEETVVAFLLATQRRSEK